MLQNYNSATTVTASGTICPGCGSTRASFIQMPIWHPHHAALKCGECDRFLRWEPKPANQEKQQQQQATIKQLLKSSQLNQWEQRFLEGLKGKKISPRQQEILARIEAKVGGQR